MLVNTWYYHFILTIYLYPHCPSCLLISISIIAVISSFQAWRTLILKNLSLVKMMNWKQLKSQKWQLKPHKSQEFTLHSKKRMIWGYGKKIYQVGRGVIVQIGRSTGDGCNCSKGYSKMSVSGFGMRRKSNGSGFCKPSEESRHFWVRSEKRGIKEGGLCTLQLNTPTLEDTYCVILHW